MLLERGFTWTKILSERALPRTFLSGLTAASYFGETVGGREHAGLADGFRLSRLLGVAQIRRGVVLEDGGLIGAPRFSPYRRWV
jgi:hypothetical protein